MLRIQKSERVWGNIKIYVNIRVNLGHVLRRTQNDADHSWSTYLNVEEQSTAFLRTVVVIRLSEKFDFASNLRKCECDKTLKTAFNLRQFDVPTIASSEARG